MFHEHLFDLVSFLDDLYNRTDRKNVNINCVFQVKKESAKIGYCQEFHDEAESEHNYNKYNAYSNAQRNRIIINISKHLKHLEKPKITVEKRFTLIKFHRFVVSKDQYYWMYQYPSADDVKLSDETS